jgi:hypothetical protein
MGFNTHTLHACHRVPSAPCALVSTCVVTPCACEWQRASTVLRAEGAASARRMLAEAEAQALSDIRLAVSRFGIRGVDYLTASRCVSLCAFQLCFQVFACVCRVFCDCVDAWVSLRGCMCA